MTVLILTSEDDVTADMVIHRLTAMATPVLRLDPADIPGRVDLAARFTAGGGVDGHLATDRQRVDLADIRSIWVRRPGRPGASAIEQPEWVATETEQALYGMLRATGAAWMNHPDAAARARHKPWQLATATAAGLRIPDTIFTTIPGEASAFAAGGPVVVKSVSGRHPENPPVTVPTARVPPGADYTGVAAAATCLQREVPKVRDLRLTVVSDQTFPCFIAPTDGQTLDWRWLPPEQCTWVRDDIPAALAGSVRRYMAAASLAYAALDFAVTEQDQYWFLEANQAGQFGFVEITTGAPIAQAIAEWLAHPSPTGVQHPSQHEREA